MALFNFRRRLRRFDPVFQAVAFSFDHNRFAVMKEAVEDGGGHGGIVIEDGGPLFERFVGGDADGPPFVTLADDLEQQVGAGLVNGHIPEFIEGQELGFQEGFEFGLEAVRVLRGEEGIDQIDGGDPPDGIALVAGVIAEC